MSMIDSPLVSVIIPTSCESRREGFLNRSINSIVRQTDAKIEILLVCNGNQQDQNIINSLAKNNTIKILRISEGNVSKARYEGLCSSSGEYFCFLDDDDEFLDGGISRRLEILQANPEYDVVVTNGLLNTSNGDSQLVSDKIVDKIKSDPPLAFLEQNWFASPAPMFRRSKIKEDVFNFKLKHFEWTYLFFLLISSKKSLFFDNHPTYRIHDNHQSVSKSIEYNLAYPDFLQTLKKLDLDQTIKSSIHKKYITALNSKSNFYLEQHQLLDAWKTHLLCLLKGGFKYLPYTRHLLFHSKR